MRKIIILSLIASFALAENSVTNLTIDQINKIQTSSNFSNGATVSQGQTDIKNNSNVAEVSITQRVGTDAGNLIEDTNINGTNSEVYQGLTSVDNSRLEHAELTSQNKLKGVTVTGGKSTIRQANLIIGGESNVTGTAGGVMDPNNPGGNTGENIIINQINTLQDTEIKNSIIEQGVTRINGGAKVSNTFNLDQTNTINRVSATGKNDLNASTITQGVTTIVAGQTSNIEQKIENEMRDITVDNAQVSQSTIILNDSTVENINNGNTIGTVDDKNSIQYLDASANALVQQSVIDISQSDLNGFENYEKISLNNRIETLDIDNSKSRQSVFKASSNSHISNIAYKLHNVSTNANNVIYGSDAKAESELNQEVTDIENSTVSNLDVYRKNAMTFAHATNSKLNQNELSVVNSTLENSTVEESNLMYNLYSTNANLSQGSTIITD